MDMHDSSSKDSQRLLLSYGYLLAWSISIKHLITDDSFGKQLGTIKLFNSQNQLAVEQVFN